MNHPSENADFGDVLNRFMERANVGETELARRVGVTRLTVRRWRQGEMKPKEDAVKQLRQGLRWVDGNGRVRELDDAEMLRLQIAAGHISAVSTQPDTDRIEPTDRCVVYSHRYSPDAYPSKWSKRIMELERSVPGSMYVMWSGLPSITRPAAFYAREYERRLYRQDLNEAFMAAHRERQRAFEKRLGDSRVSHIYAKRQVERYLDRASAVGRFKDVPEAVIHEQLNTIIRWLEAFDNFEIGLTERAVVSNVTILGHRTVLLGFPQPFALLTGDNVMGLEIVGPEAATQFTEQFDSVWSDRAMLKDKRDVIEWFNSFRRNRPA